MRFRAALCLIPAVLGLWSVLRAQRPFKEYPALEYIDFPLPPDWEQKAEWTRARLRVPGTNRGFRSSLNWTMDYPRSDRHLLQGVRRLTRIDTRSVEQVVDLDGADDVYNWPAMYAVEVGHWSIPDDQAAQLRDFLVRGGFLMVDDFHGTYEWQVFLEGIHKVLPGREIVDIDNKDPIFHTLYDLEDAFRFPARPPTAAASLTNRMATIRTGGRFTTTKAGSSSRFATTWISATPGSYRMSRITSKSGRLLPTASR
jgi:hypothetical protein